MDATQPEASGSGRDPDRVRMSQGGTARTWATWWLICAAVWLVLDDTVVLPELVDGAVAATIGASAATVAASRAQVRLAAPAAWMRRWWRPLIQFTTDVPILARVLFAALRGIDREPGELRTVAFEMESDPERRAAQLALATYAGSLAPNTVVVAADAERGSLLVHELVARAGDAGADPLELG